MRLIKLLPILMVVVFVGCSKTDTEQYTIATPITQSIAEFRASVDIVSPQPIIEPGKMYVYGDYVFVNEQNEGVHVINNQDPNSPQKINFLKIKGNNDISVKDDILYADSKMDLVYFDISNINQIAYLGRLEDVLPQNYDWPSADVYNTQDLNFDTTLIVDWTITVDFREVPDYDETIVINDAGNSGGETGQGGSLARFKIVNEYLYAVDSNNLNVFNIADLTNPQDQGEVGVGWAIETIFSNGEYLYIGSAVGMFIYDLVNPSAPQYLSSIEHVQGCDPVVVQGDYAYVTIRGGGWCGQPLSQMDVINVADKSNPYIVTTIPMGEPYGLGVKENALYVSDGPNGLKLFNVEDPEAIFLEREFPEINITDVIPMEDKLLLIGDDTLYQFNYEEGDISLISTFNLN